MVELLEIFEILEIFEVIETIKTHVKDKILRMRKYPRNYETDSALKLVPA